MDERHVKEIEVVRNTTGEVVRSVNCLGEHEHTAKIIERGMHRMMDHEKYHTRMVYVEDR